MSAQPRCTSAAYCLPRMRSLLLHSSASAGRRGVAAASAAASARFASRSASETLTRASLAATDTFAPRHIGPRDADIAAMLRALPGKYASLDALSDATVPDAIKLKAVRARARAAKIFSAHSYYSPPPALSPRPSAAAAGRLRADVRDRGAGRAARHGRRQHRRQELLRLRVRLAAQRRSGTRRARTLTTPPPPPLCAQVPRHAHAGRHPSQHP